jgi:hypothetical protein
LISESSGLSGDIRVLRKGFFLGSEKGSSVIDLGLLGSEEDLVFFTDKKFGQEKDTEDGN